MADQKEDDNVVDLIPHLAKEEPPVELVATEDVAMHVDVAAGSVAIGVGRAAAAGDLSPVRVAVLPVAEQEGTMPAMPCFHLDPSQAFDIAMNLLGAIDYADMEGIAAKLQLQADVLRNLVSAGRYWTSRE